MNKCPRRMHFALIIALLVGGVFYFINEYLISGQDTATLVVTSHVNPKCVFRAGGGILSFGEYDPVVLHASTPLDADGSFDIKCTKLTVCQIGIGYGLHASGTIRRMESSGSYLNYELYKEASRSSIWGDTGAMRVSYTAATSQYFTEVVYGRVPAGQDVGVGSYSDTCVIIAEF